MKKVLLKLSQNSQESTSKSLFFNKVAVLRPSTLFKKKTLALEFSCEFAKFLKTPIFKEHLRWLLLLLLTTVIRWCGVKIEKMTASQIKEYPKSTHNLKSPDCVYSLSYFRNMGTDFKMFSKCGWFDFEKLAHEGT